MMECLQGSITDWGKVKSIQRKKRHSSVKTMQPSCSGSTDFVVRTLAMIGLCPLLVLPCLYQRILWSLKQ